MGGNHFVFYVKYVESPFYDNWTELWLINSMRFRESPMSGLPAIAVLPLRVILFFTQTECRNNIQNV